MSTEGYHSAKHEGDNVQHLDPRCPHASTIHTRCSCPRRPRSCRACGVGRAMTEPAARVTALYEECVKVARSGGTTAYSTIAPLAWLDMNREADRWSISDYLDQISRREYLEGRPLLSAVVVLKSQNRPGTGFFTLARELGLHSGNDDDRYWTRELERVHQHWRDA